ncbi:hypothetical protein H0E84_08275 [Luteimonas sp. SJ-92]|uniref:DUF4177 domain-containing protein n=1 Tax=Luteimonas salinisoli TaxID=2752307 RepID=A0A853JCS3_9GAMM|nr:hypothetical protein [Luteimonas salinisoli]NZA26380.1 hypothetical protein [Luteimonas salinisoli]
MTHWNYKVAVVESTDPAEMEKQFEQHDARGWELVSLTQMPVLSMVAVFRKARG